MSVKDFSEAMGELDVKYIEKAMNYQAKKKKNGWLKWGALAACLCLLVVGGLSVGDLISGRSGCGSQLSHNITLADEKMYYTCNDCVYLYDINNSTQKKIADFNGILTQTHSGLYLFDEEAGDVYSVFDSMLTLVGSIEPNSTLIDVLGNRIYYRTYQNDGVYSYSIAEKDLTVGTISDVVSVSNSHMIAQTIIGNKLYYCTTENGGTISVFDMQTKESTTIYNSQLANGTEMRNVVFYDDFILLETEQGLYSMRYNDKETIFLSEYIPTTGALDCFGKKIYFIIAVPVNEYFEEELISLNVQTGAISTVMQLTENGATQTYTEIVVCDSGYFYTNPSATEGGLFYHSFDGDADIAICRK